MGRATGKNNKNLGALDLIKGLYETLGGAGRGVTSATLGLPGDLEGLLRMLTPGVSNEPVLPNTDRMLKAIPGPDNTMSELGRNLPLTPTQAMKVGAPLARGAAEQVHRGMMGQGPLKGALQSVAPMNVVKDKGGNWLTNTVDEALKPEMRTANIQRLLPEDRPIYQPFIRDFLESQQWDTVKDMGNTGLIDTYGRFPAAKELGVKRFVTPDELEKIQFELGGKAMKTDMGKTLDDPNFNAGWEPDDVIEFAEGGLVQAPAYFDNLDEFLDR